MTDAKKKVMSHEPIGVISLEERGERGTKYSEWWGQMLNAKTKGELTEKLQGTIADLQQLLVMMDEETGEKDG